MKKKFKEKFKKQVTLALATILTLGSLPLQSIDTFAGTGETVVIKQGSLGDGTTVAFKGDNPGATTHNLISNHSVDSSNPNNTAYCITPGASGVDSGNQTVKLRTDAELYPEDRVIMGIMLAGYPNNTHGLSALDAYTATQIAIQHYLFQHSDSYYNIISGETVSFKNDSWSHWSPDNSQKTAIIDKAKIIYANGLANPYTGSVDSAGSLTISATDDGKLERGLVDTKIETTITIDSTTPYTSGTLTFDDPVMQSIGTTVTIDGVVTPINNNTVQLPANAKEVVVSVDKSLAEAEHEKKYPGDENASEYFTVNATIKTVGNGGASANIGDNVRSGQNYTVMMQGNDIAIQQSIKWNRTTEPVEPSISKLKIVKVEAGTTKGLEGAVFKITSHVEGMEGVLGTYTTNSQGEINLDAIVGWYEVQEVVPPAGYVLSDNNHQDIYVAEEVESVVTFENKKKTEIEITKIDGVTKKPLANATIRIALDGGSNYVDVVTGADGKAKLDNLTEGTYLVTEVISPEGYLLNETPYSIKLLSGQVGKITIPNYSGGTTTLIKYDEATGLPLENAEFSLSKKDGSIIYEGMTGGDGTITITDLETGWYTWSEIAPPTNYFMTVPSKDFYLDASKHVTVKFDNREKPSLKIRKIDSKTGEALVGATFKIWATEGATVIEKQTDKNGELLLEHLDEGVYSIQEINAPTGEVIVPGQMLGYKTGANKALEIIEEEAETVRMIFRMFLEGESYSAIARRLEELGRKTGAGKSKWDYNVVVNILKNEKYKGDAILQKTYTRDFMDKKRKKNNGEKRAYYVQNSHPAIISREDSEKVEKELRRRAIHRNKNNRIPNTKYVLSDVLVCAECGSPYRRVTWKGQYDEPRYVWRCDNRLKNGKKYCKKSPTLNESELHRAIMDCIAEITEKNNIEQIVLQNKNKLKQQDKTFHIDKQKQILEQELEKYKLEIDKLIEEELNGGDVGQKYKEISEKIQNIKNELEKHKNEGVDNLTINSISSIDRTFAEGLVRQLIHKINVISKEEIEIEFVSAVKIIKKLTEY